VPAALLVSTDDRARRLTTADRAVLLCFGALSSPAAAASCASRRAFAARSCRRRTCRTGPPVCLNRLHKRDEPRRSAGRCRARR